MLGSGIALTAILVCINLSIVCFTSASAEFSHEGEACVLRSGENGAKGTCRRRSQCVPARCGRRYGVPVSVCSMEGFDELVCCVDKRPSVKACERFENGNTRPYIAKGEKAIVKEFPHMAALGFVHEESPRKTKWLCGGSLISNRFVLTAAHCVTDPFKGTLKKVKLGSLKLKSKREKNTIVIDVDELFVANNFKPPAKYNDLALIKLVKKVDFEGTNYYIYPACLNTKPLPVNMMMTVTGYGHADTAGTTAKDVLRKANLTFWDRVSCQKQFKNDKIQLPNGLAHSMICAGGDGAGDTCAGDSGGPIQMTNGVKTPYIYGITSFGKDPCGGSRPSVYTNVLHYLDWIECIVWPNEDYEL